MSTKYFELQAKVADGTITQSDIENNVTILNPTEYESILDGYTGLQLKSAEAVVASTHVRVVGDQAAAPTGVWSSFAIQPTGNTLTVDGLLVPDGSTYSAEGDAGRTIESPVISGGPNYSWVGYRVTST